MVDFGVSSFFSRVFVGEKLGWVRDGECMCPHQGTD